MQEQGFITLRIMSRPGRINMSGHIMTIVRNILGEEAATKVGRIRMLTEDGQQVSLQHFPCTHLRSVVFQGSALDPFQEEANAMLEQAHELLNSAPASWH